MAAGSLYAYSDEQVRSLWETMQAAVLSRKTLVSWDSGDSSATKMVEVKVADWFPIVQQEILRRFPDQVGRRPITRTVATFS